MRLFIYIVLLVFSIGVYVFLIMNLAYFIFGFFSFIKAKELGEEDIINIKKFGISHKTTSKGKVGIEKDEKIKGSIGRKSYSNHFKKAVYFFANAYMKKGESFNDNLKYEYILNIINLSDNQIKNMKKRTYDNAILYMGDFKFEECNEVKYKKIEKEKYNLFQKVLYYLKAFLSIRVDKYICGLSISAIISFGIVFIMTYLLLTFLGLM